MCFRFRSVPFPFCFLSSASVPVLTTWPLFLPVLFLPASASQWLLRCALPLSLLWLSPFFPTRFPVSSSPVLRTRLSVCFLSPFINSLPQLFLKCFPSALALGLFPFLPLSFVCFRSGSGYSAFCFFLSSSSLLCLSAALQVLPLFLSASLLFPVLSNLVSHVFFPGSSYSAFCISFLRSLSRLTVTTSVSHPSSFRLPASSPLLSL